MGLLYLYLFIISSHLHLGLPIGSFPACFPFKMLYAPLLYPIRATCPTHLILLNLLARIILGEQYRSVSSSLCNTQKNRKKNSFPKLKSVGRHHADCTSASPQARGRRSVRPALTCEGHGRDNDAGTSFAATIPASQRAALRIEPQPGHRLS